MNNVPACDDATANMADCGIIPAPVDCSFAPGDLATACVLVCYATASCADLTSSLCVGDGSTAFATCINGCGGVELPCGDGTTYQASFGCDGTADCANAADEASCDLFDCQNGETVPAAAGCDMVDDCSNGADEADCSTLTCPEYPTATCAQASAQLSSCGLLEGDVMTGCLDDVPFQACMWSCVVGATCTDLTTYFCTDDIPAALQTCGVACGDTAPNAFFCANGTAVAAASQCNGVADCADSSDEAGCQGPCADGTTMITYADLCDGANDCPDGEDEFSCFAV